MTSPLLQHPLDEPSAFTPEALVGAVKAQRGLQEGVVPEICVLDFDGDLTDKLVAAGVARRHRSWACFHTTLFSWEAQAGVLAFGRVAVPGLRESFRYVRCSYRAKRRKGG